MKTKDFLQISKKYIFKACLKCGENQDSKFILNYDFAVNMDFRDCEIYITDSHKKYLYEIKYEDIASIDFMVCSRYTSGTKIARRDYNITYTIHMNNHASLYFESMSYLIWKDIIEILNKNKVVLNDPLNLFEMLVKIDETSDFYAYCEQNMESWKSEFQIVDPKINNLIGK